MKTFTKIILFFMLALIFFGVASIFIVKSDEAVFGKNSKFEESINLVETLDNLNDANHVTIKTVSSDVKFHQSGSDEFKAHLVGKAFNMGFIKGEYELYLNHQGLQVEIIEKVPRFNFGINISDTTLDVYLPSNFSGKLTITTVSGDIDLHLPTHRFGDVQVKTVSGDIMVNNLNWDAEDLESQLLIDTVSGDIDLRAVRIGNSQFKAVSGDIDLDRVIAKSMTINTTSGDIEGEVITSETITYKTISGDVEVRGDFKNVNVNTTSGTVEIKNSALIFNYQIKAISGDVKLDIDTESEFSYDLSTTSGDIEIILNKLEKNSRSKAKGFIGSSSNIIDINTTSGDIKIK